MKKIFITVLATLILLSGFTYAQEIGQEQYITERFGMYGYTPNQADIDYWSKITRNQFGTLEQNLQRRFSQNKFAEETVVIIPFADKIEEGIFGASPKRPSEFKTNLAEQKTEGHSNTTLKVTSITTKDGNTLDGSVLGDLIVLSINPGGSNSEIVVCTGLTTATKTFTGCTFGYRFDNPTATQSANIEAHAPGEPVIISDSDTYLVQQYVTIDGDEALFGSKTIASTTEPLVRLYFGNNRGAYIWYNTTTDQFGWASSTSEFQFNTGGTQFTAVRPLSVTSGELKLATSTYWFTYHENLLGLATSTGTALPQFWNRQFNATSTADNFNFASTTLSGLTLITGNATTSLSLDALGDVRINGVLDFRNGSTATGTPTTTEDFAFHFLDSLYTKVNVMEYNGFMAKGIAGGSINTTTASLVFTTTAGASTDYTSASAASNVNLVKNFSLNITAALGDVSAHDVWFGAGTNQADNSCEDNVSDDQSAWDGDGAGFVVYSAGSVLEAFAGNGTDHTTSTNVISGITLSNTNYYKIKRVGNEINYYVNESKVATILTNLPDITGSFNFCANLSNRTTDAGSATFGNNVNNPFFFVGKK